MTSKPRIDADLLAQCESEPIHIPGAIQPFGILLTVEPQCLQIHNASENCGTFSGTLAQETVGRSLADFLTKQDADAVRKYLSSNNLADQSPLSITSVFSDEKQNHVWELKAHEHLGVLFLELEPVRAASIASESNPFHRRIQDAISTLQRTKSVQELCEATAAEIKDIAGFDRVMIYRFDPGWHGVVVAEACNPDVDSYLGLHFPAGDIPSQARAIFLQNWLRMIPNVDYTPSKIYPGRHPATGSPLDLGKTLLRSVSPIHLQYLRNMDVGASLTVSLIKDGKLWGLIACHHNSPLLVDHDIRIGAQILGQFASSQLHVKEAEEELGYRTSLKLLNQQLVSSLGSEDELAKSLSKYADDVLRFAGSKSGAIRYKGEWTTFGSAPSVPAMERIVAWLSEHTPPNGVFHTDSLVRHIPEAVAFKDIASGLLAIELTKAEKNYFLWFRPEVATTVTWAGAPDKTVVQVNGQDTLHPRASFKSWKEVVNGKALPWKAVEIEAIEQLRTYLLSISLEQEFRKEQAARNRAERLSREKEEMVMVVSHDLRTPLSLVVLSFEFLQRAKPSDDPVVLRMIDRGAYGAQAMETLISEILDVSKIESGTMVLDLSPENSDSLSEMAVDMFLPLAKEKNIHLILSRSNIGYAVLCERNRILQVFSNLISNALKFTPSNGKIVVSAEERNNEVVFCVADTGTGISEENLPMIFDRFWQGHETKHMGTGLGLWISKSIIEKHGGKIWATSKLGVGTNFYFSLPIHTKPSLKNVITS